MVIEDQLFVDLITAMAKLAEGLDKISADSVKRDMELALLMKDLTLLFMELEKRVNDLGIMVNERIM